MQMISKGRLAKMMLENLLSLSDGTTHLKDNVTVRLGMVGSVSSTRELTAAWNETKKRAVKSHPERFILDDRGVLHWNDGSVKILDKKISSANYKKLNEIADTENCTVNSVISKLVSTYAKSKKRG